MTTLEEVAQRLERIEARLAGNESPYLRCDSEAAAYAGFKSRTTFRRWAKEKGIRPVIRGGLNLWEKSKLR